MRAKLTNYHQAPRKVRLVADLIRGKSVPEAQASLRFLPKKSGLALSKLLSSAVANARGTGASENSLFVKTITVNKGLVMRRYRPFARGRAGVIRKTMSIISLELGSSSKAQGTGQKAQAKKTSVKKAATKKSPSSSA